MSGSQVRGRVTGPDQVTCLEVLVILQEVLEMPVIQISHQTLQFPRVPSSRSDRHAIDVVYSMKGRVSSDGNKKPITGLYKDQS